MTRARSCTKILFTTLACLFVGPTLLHAQGVTVSPTAVYIDSRTRTETLVLHNPSGSAAEVVIEFAFGYPQSDDAGNVSVPLTLEPEAGEPSALGWLRAFPRRFLLQPGQRQVVRVLAEPPASLPDGEYWARLVVTSRGSGAPVEDAPGGLRVRLDLANRIVTAANYRQGTVRTGVEIIGATVVREGDGVNVSVDLARSGNAAFLGRVQADVIDANDDVVTTAWDDVAVYRTMLRLFAIDLPPGTEGPLRVRLTIDSGREDLPAGAALPIDTVTRVIPISP
jgi:hypothetical protein